MAPSQLSDVDIISDLAVDQLVELSVADGAYSGTVRTIAFLVFNGFIDFEMLSNDNFISKLVIFADPASGKTQLLKDIRYHFEDIRAQVVEQVDTQD